MILSIYKLTPLIQEPFTVDLSFPTSMIDDKTKHKRERFKALLGPRVKKMVKYHKQIKNLANQRNYVYTEQEAKQVEQLYQLMLDEIGELFLDQGKFPIDEIKFSHTEAD